MTSQERRQAIARLQAEEAADSSAAMDKLPPAKRWRAEMERREADVLMALNPRRGKAPATELEQEVLHFWRLYGMVQYAMAGGAQPFPGAETAHLDLDQADEDGPFTPVPVHPES